MTRNSLPSHLQESFNERERSILALLARRFSNREIAETLHLSLDTVKWYNKRIFSKLGVNRRSEAAKRAGELLLIRHAEETMSQSSAPAPRADRLPTPIATFVGREQELADLRQMVEAHRARLVTILAPGGTGKTQLALRLAHWAEDKFTSGAFFVPLASLTSDAHVMTTLAQHFGLRDDSSERSSKEQVLDFLSNKHLLLILDGFEHVLESAPVITDILQSAENVRVIVTSRERLNLLHETVYLLGGLAYPESVVQSSLLAYPAVRLFVERARQVQPEFAPQDIDSIVRICQIAGGLPLAIELAAAWSSVLSPAEIVRQVTDNIDFLQTDMHDVPARLRSIRAIFDWTWARLTPGEQTVFRRMSIFRGSCTWQALQAVTGAKPETVARLVNRAVVWRIGDHTRYQMHELLQHFAREQLDAASEAETMAQAHSRYYVNLLAALRTDLEGGRQIEASSDMQLDYQDICAAWLHACDYGQDALIRAGLHSLWLYYYVRGLYPLGIMFFEQSLQRLGDHPELRAMILARQAYLYVRFSKAAKATETLAQCEALLHPAQEGETHAFIASVRGWLACEIGKFDEAVPFFERSVALYRTLGDRWGIGFALLGLGRSYCMRDGMSEEDIAHALHCLQEATAIQRSMGDILHLAHVYKLLGMVASVQRNRQEDERLARLSLHYYQLLGNRERTAGCLEGLAQIVWLNGQLGAARQLMTESLKLYKETGDRAHIARKLGNFAIHLYDSGEFDLARRYAEEGLLVVEGTTYERWIGVCLFQVARVSFAQGLYAESVEHFQRVIELERRANGDKFACEELLHLSNAFHAQGKLEDAKRVLEEAHEIAQHLEHPLLLSQYRLEWSYVAYTEGRYADARAVLQTILALIRSGALQRFFLNACDETFHLNARILTLISRVEAREGNHAAAWAYLREALTLPHLTLSPPRTLSVLTAAAILLVDHGSVGDGLKLATYIYTNPKTYAIDKAEVAHLVTHTQARAFGEAQEGAITSIEEAIAHLLS